MRLRVTQAAGGDQVEAWSGTHWVRFSDIAEAGRVSGGWDGPKAIIEALAALQDRTVEWERLAAQARPVDAARKVVIPFRPTAYRDFLLYERHAIDATRGYYARFAPETFEKGVAYERKTGETFEAFRPRESFYKRPGYYMGNPGNFITRGDRIEWPDFTEALDYELELGVILVRPIYKASPDEVRAAIGGVTVFNDCSARDVQLDEMNSGFGPQRSKNFANSISNEIVSFDEVDGRLEALRGEVRINGEIVASCASSNPHFSIPQALSIVSQSERLHAGEMVGSGTWPGGSGMENGHWLAPGDELTLSIEGVASVTNHIGRRGEAIWPRSGH